MENTEVKTMLSERLGLPISFFDGESPEEDIATAKALCAYRREHEQKKTKTPQEQFGEYMDAQMGIERPDESQQIISDIEKNLMIYPKIKDAGETMIGDTRSACEQFEEWFNQKAAIDPRKVNDLVNIGLG